MSEESWAEVTLFRDVATCSIANLSSWSKSGHMLFTFGNNATYDGLNRNKSILSFVGRLSASQLANSSFPAY